MLDVRPADMVFRMKTTLIIDDGVMKQLKQTAAREGTSISALVESALRLFLREARAPATDPPLPTFSSGGHLVDVADREALYRAMDER